MSPLWPKIDGFSHDETWKAFIIWEAIYCGDVKRILRVLSTCIVLCSVITFRVAATWYLGVGLGVSPLRTLTCFYDILFAGQQAFTMSAGARNDWNDQVFSLGFVFVSRWIPINLCLHNWRKKWLKRPSFSLGFVFVSRWIFINQCLHKLAQEMIETTKSFHYALST